MMNGLIVEDHRIIALDLKSTLSRDYKIIAIVSNAAEAEQWKDSDAQFVLMDTDIRGSCDALKEILDILHCTSSKVILLSSVPIEMMNPHFTYHNIVYKPFSNKLLLEAIEH